MSEKYAFGHSWNGQVSAFVSRNLETGKVFASYNLTDYTGDHTKNSAHYKSQSPETRIIIDSLIISAREDMKNQLAYMLARKRETTFDHLQFCYLVTVGYGGVTWHIDEKPDSTGTIQGYSLSDDEKAEIDRLGIPFVDITTIDHEDCITPSISGPMPPNKPDRGDDAPYNSFSYAPLPVYCEFWRRLGANVKNIDSVELTPAQFSNPRIQALLA